MIRMRIREVSSCADHRQVVVVLEDGTGQQRLAIGLSADDSRRLVRELSPGRGGPDPMYGFVGALLRVSGMGPTRVVLEYEPDAGIRCAVILDRGEGEASVPCSASDALGLAQRLEIPLYASDEMFTAPAETMSPPPEAHDRHDVARWLDRVRPADFRRSSRESESTTD